MNAIEATIANGLLFELSGDGLEIALALDGKGGATRLSYRSGEDAREFSGEEITVAVSDEGTRAAVVLESGAARGPIVRFRVLVPAVIVGSTGRSFEVSAAGLRSAQRSLFAGPRPGPQQSYEALTLEGTVSCTPGAGPLGTCHDWFASHDHTPPGPPTLRVTGTCTFPTAGYTVKLRRHVPQSIDPKHLLLDKIVIAGPVAQVITDVEARYEEITDVVYDTVTILPEGLSIAVEDIR